MLNPRFLRFTMLALAMGLALVAFGCSNAANKTTTMTGANVQFKIGDAPADSVLSLVLTITVRAPSASREQSPRPRASRGRW